MREKVVKGLPRGGKMMIIQMRGRNKKGEGCSPPGGCAPVSSLLYLLYCTRNTNDSTR